MNGGRLWLHGTKDHIYQDVMDKGFVINYNDILGGRWGYGIYLTNCVYWSKCFGSNIIKVAVDESKIIEFDYSFFRYKFEDSDLNDEYDHNEEYGDKRVENYVKKLGYGGVIIKYKTGVRELCVYNSDILKIQGLLVDDCNCSVICSPKECLDEYYEEA